LTVTRLDDADNPFTVHRSLNPDCPFVLRTLTKGGFSVTGPERAQDAIDGFGLNSDSSLPSDVEEDGPLQEELAARGVDKKGVGVTAATAKPLRPAAPISKSCVSIIIVSYRG